MKPLITPIVHHAEGMLLFDINRCCVLVARSEA
jgi:hypothetical protein